MSELRGRAAGSGRVLAIVAFVALAFAPLVGPSTANAAPAAAAAVTPKAECGPGAKPETDIQGRVPTVDYDSGRTAQGYQCNTEQVGHEGESGGFRVYRYVDAAGHECAYYDTTLLVGTQLLLGQNAGVAVLDMTDPAHPVRTATLSTPAMLSPHESLNLNQQRGLLAAIDGSPATAPGVVDIYDVSGDCRTPVLKWTGPIGGAGHEATFAPDGNTLYTTATALPYVTALDVTNPSVPIPVWISTDFTFHGMNVSDDGNRLYAADLGSAPSGLTILDVSQIQQRVMNPQVPVVSQLTWDDVSIPQTNIPITIGGHPYLVEIDEYSRGTSTAADAPVGAARIIDIADETAPVAISEMRLEVNDADNRAGPEKDDPGAGDPAQGYAGHYCAVPQRTDPGIVACSFIMSGLRVFDIHDPYHPSEIAYFNPPSRDVLDAPTAAAVASSVPNLYVCRLAVTATESSSSSPPSPADTFTSFPASPLYGSTLTHWAMSAPTFVPSRNEVWYSDGMYGFYAVRLTNNVWSPVVAATARPPTRPPVRPSRRPLRYRGRGGPNRCCSSPPCSPSRSGRLASRPPPAADTSDHAARDTGAIATWPPFAAAYVGRDLRNRRRRAAQQRHGVSPPPRSSSRSAGGRSRPVDGTSGREPRPARSRSSRLSGEWRERGGGAGH